jgi:hypothetical protein
MFGTVAVVHSCCTVVPEHACGSPKMAVLLRRKLLNPNNRPKDGLVCTTATNALHELFDADPIPNCRFSMTGPWVCATGVHQVHRSTRVRFFTFPRGVRDSKIEGAANSKDGGAWRQ